MTLQASTTLKSKINSRTQCEFCSRAFSRETSLLNHVCEQKRRHQQQHDPEVQLGLRAFQEFYRVSLNKRHQITYAEFSRNNFYLAFVRFGRYLRALEAIDALSYTRWLIKNSVKIDSWCSDKIYETWLKQYVLEENPSDAVTRSIHTMTAWAEKHSAEFSGFFRYGNENQIVWLISTGKISAWCVYCSESGRQFLERLNTEQFAAISDYINPDLWSKKLAKYQEETAWMTSILASAGL